MHRRPDTYDGITYVIPCGGAKLDDASPARDLYIGSMFRHTLANVERLAGMDEAEGRGPARVLILSARHGLVQLDDVLEPYDQRMDAAGSVPADTLAGQALALGIDWGAEVYALLPRPYLSRLDAALRTLDVYVQDVYEATGGIGEQRRVNSIVGRPTVAPAAPDTAPGPMVWLGGDVHTFAWNTPILVSYGRLRDARTMPVATAPWVCDSAGFAELATHGTWTIDPHQYAADLQRYAREIGMLTWAAPQDWPAAAPMLAKTGLTEREHQERTIASVVQLRQLAPDVPVIAVITGTTAAGYLRHVAMYREHGLDLTAERIVVGVGALVGRRPQEQADIIRLLHSTGLHHLHGFGVKGRVLDLVGDLLASVDSAAWSTEARRRGGHCKHGLVEWERNCPRAAQDWGTQQRARAARPPAQEQLPLFAA